MLRPYILAVEDTVVQVREYVVFAKDDKDAMDRVLRGEYVSESEATTTDTLQSHVKSALYLTAVNDEVRAAVIVNKRKENDK